MSGGSSRDVGELRALSLEEGKDVGHLGLDVGSAGDAWHGAVEQLHRRVAHRIEGAARPRKRVVQPQGNDLGPRARRRRAAGA